MLSAPREAAPYTADCLCRAGLYAPPWLIGSVGIAEPDPHVAAVGQRDLLDEGDRRSVTGRISDDGVGLAHFEEALLAEARAAQAVGRGRLERPGRDLPVPLVDVEDEARVRIDPADFLEGALPGLLLAVHVELRLHRVVREGRNGHGHQAGHRQPAQPSIHRQHPPNVTKPGVKSSISYIDTPGGHAKIGR